MSFPVSELLGEFRPDELARGRIVQFGLGGEHRRASGRGLCSLRHPRVESGYDPDRLHVTWNLGVDLMMLTCAQLRKVPRLS